MRARLCSGACPHHHAGVPTFPNGSSVFTRMSSRPVPSFDAHHPDDVFPGATSHAFPLPDAHRVVRLSRALRDSRVLSARSGSTPARLARLVDRRRREHGGDEASLPDRHSRRPLDGRREEAVARVRGVSLALVPGGSAREDRSSARSQLRRPALRLASVRRERPRAVSALRGVHQGVGRDEAERLNHRRRARVRDQRRAGRAGVPELPSVLKFREGDEHRGRAVRFALGVRARSAVERRGGGPEPIVRQERAASRARSRGADAPRERVGRKELAGAHRPARDHGQR